MPPFPYPVCIGRLVDCLSGAVQPVYVQVAPTIPRLLTDARSLPLDVTILSTTLAVNRVIGVYSGTGEQKWKGGGHTSRCLQAGVFWPDI
jgi:hypothetical protein